MSEPLWVKHMCDVKCNEIGFKFYDFGGIVTEEGGTSHAQSLQEVL